VKDIERHITIDTYTAPTMIFNPSSTNMMRILRTSGRQKQRSGKYESVVRARLQATLVYFSIILDVHRTNLSSRVWCSEEISQIFRENGQSGAVSFQAELRTIKHHNINGHITGTMVALIDASIVPARNDQMLTEALFFDLCSSSILQDGSNVTSGGAWVSDEFVNILITHAQYEVSDFLAIESLSTFIKIEVRQMPESYDLDKTTELFGYSNAWSSTGEPTWSMLFESSTYEKQLLSFSLRMAIMSTKTPDDSACWCDRRRTPVDVSTKLD